MKLSISDIRFTESGYASATAEVCGKKSIFPVCEMDIRIPLVEGKLLEQYKDELLAEARERIAEMYKEIVCGGEPGDIPDFLKGEITPSELGNELLGQVKGACSNRDLEERVAALEKRVGEQTSSYTLKAIYDTGKKAADDVLSQREKRPSEEAQICIMKNCYINGKIQSNKPE
ncbi:hypothetical protein ID80_004830 [Salmonella enterica subsp. enterica serovar Ball]|nr:hypothetical protein [Salmonella enterica subsp. enterica serovar Ball]